MELICPKCGRPGEIAGDPDHNDNENVVTLVAPDGFRKVVLGSRGRAVLLYCTDCCVPAEIRHQ
jgi:hypothetical protein